MRVDAHHDSTAEKMFLSTGEIAIHCGVTFRTVIRWINRGYLQAYRLPGRGDHRVAKDEFLSFLTKNKLRVPESFVDRSRKILIVENELYFAKSMQQVLSAEGFQTEIATDGFHAGLTLLSFKPALITLDLNMPGVNGFDVLKTLSRDKTPNRPKVLIVSGAGKEQIKKAILHGADDALEKPFDSNALITKVTHLLGADCVPMKTPPKGLKIDPKI